MKFNDFSGLVIHEIMMNIMSCHGFLKVTTSIVIIACRSSLVPYYLSRGFIIVEKLDGISVNIPDPVLKQTNASPLYYRYSILECKEAIPPIVKALKKM